GCLDPQPAAVTETRNLRPPRRPQAGAEARLAFEHVAEPVEVAWDEAAEGSAGRQIDVQDEARGPERDRRAIADQDADGRVAVLRLRDVLGLEDLCRGSNVLVLAGEIHPEQDAAELPCLAVSNLVLTYAFGVPHATARPDFEERSGLQSGALHRAARTCAVARTGLTSEHVPEVVEAAVRMLRVPFRPFRSDWHHRLVHEDERVHE